jgi:hypothetical protein
LILQTQEASVDPPFYFQEKLNMIKKRFFKTKDEVEVTFEYEEAEGVNSVALVSEHNNWQPVEMPAQAWWFSGKRAAAEKRPFSVPLSGKWRDVAE